MRGRQLDDRLSAGRGDAKQPSAPREQGVLDLQRAAGNAAVTRLLQRDTPTTLGMRPGSVLDYRVPSTFYSEHGAAIRAVIDWFDPSAGEITSGRADAFLLAVAELVYLAKALTYTTDEGKTGKVADQMSAGEIEGVLRERAKTKGVRLLEHRAGTDPAGVKSETLSILSNLGRIPTSIEFGGDKGKVEISIGGKVTGELKVGKGKVEGEVSAEGAEATVTLPGKTKITGRASPEGGGASLAFPGGKVSVDITSEKVKAEVKAGDFITVRGSAGTEKEGGFGWKAEIAIGTLGKIVTAEEVAKLMVGAQETFGKAAADLAKGIDPEKVKTHGGAVKDAVTEVVEKAKKSAKQAKPGWSVGAEAKGSEKGGWSVGVTFTWVF